MAIFSFCEGFFSVALQRTQKTFYLHTHGSSRNVWAHTWLCQSEAADHIRVRATLNICTAENDAFWTLGWQMSWLAAGGRVCQWCSRQGMESVPNLTFSWNTGRDGPLPDAYKIPQSQSAIVKGNSDPPYPTPFIDLRIMFQALQGHQGSSPCLLLDLISLLSIPQTHESAFGTSNTSVSPWGLYNL